MARKRDRFSGFRPGSHESIPIPVQFFTDALPLLDDVAQIQVFLYAWRVLYRMREVQSYLRQHDFLADDTLVSTLKRYYQTAYIEQLERALSDLVRLELMLYAEVQEKDRLECLYFINTENGRRLMAQIEAGQWAMHETRVEILPERPNVFELYEHNIGVLTPIIADDLKDAAAEFGLRWMEDAIHEAVSQNKRNWNYIRAILKRWKQDGRATDEANQRRARTDDERQYTSGEYADFINPGLK